MALHGVNLSKILRFVSETDPEKGVEGRETVFLFKLLDGFQASYLSDNMVGFEQTKNGEQVTKVHMGRVSFETVQFALYEAQNFLDEEGLPIEIKRVPRQIMGKTYLAIHEDVMRQLGGPLLQEMYTWYTAAAAMTETEAKKSVPQS